MISFNWAANRWWRGKVACRIFWNRRLWGRSWVMSCKKCQNSLLFSIFLTLVSRWSKGSSDITQPSTPEQTQVSNFNLKPSNFCNFVARGLFYAVNLDRCKFDAFCNLIPRILHSRVIYSLYPRASIFDEGNKNPLEKCKISRNFAELERYLQCQLCNSGTRPISMWHQIGGKWVVIVGLRRELMCVSEKKAE